MNFHVLNFLLSIDHLRKTQKLHTAKISTFTVCNFEPLPSFISPPLKLSQTAQIWTITLYKVSCVKIVFNLFEAMIKQLATYT